MKIPSVLHHSTAYLNQRLKTTSPSRGQCADGPPPNSNSFDGRQPVQASPQSVTVSHQASAGTVVRSLLWPRSAQCFVVTHRHTVTQPSHRRCAVVAPSLSLSALLLSFLTALLTVFSRRWSWWSLVVWLSCLVSICIRMSPVRVIHRCCTIALSLLWWSSQHHYRRRLHRTPSAMVCHSGSVS